MPPKSNCINSDPETPVNWTSKNNPGRKKLTELFNHQIVDPSIDDYNYIDKQVWDKYQDFFNFTRRVNFRSRYRTSAKNYLEKVEKEGKRKGELFG